MNQQINETFWELQQVKFMIFSNKVWMKDMLDVFLQVKSVVRGVNGISNNHKDIILYVINKCFSASK